MPTLLPRKALTVTGGQRSCAGDAADNLVIQEAATEVADDVILDDDDREDEEEAHGLEDLGNAFQGPLNDTQEKYKAKLEAKLKQVRAAAANVILCRTARLFLVIPARK